MGMRVLIVNKFYYPRGGDCVCAMNLETMLQNAGYETAFFSMRYPENVASPDDKYFATEVSFGGGIGNKINALKRVFGIGDIRNSFSKMLHTFKPDVVHFHNIHSYLSPIIVHMAHEAGARTVWTLHDYKLICPAYSCRRSGNVNSCEECFKTPGSSPSGVIRHKCMKDSTFASGIAWLEAKVWNHGALQRYTDAFICPSEFIKNKMIQAGFEPAKLHIVSNCIENGKSAVISNIDNYTREDYYAYAGRLSPEKGTDTLLEAASQLPYRIKILGTGPDFERLKNLYSSNDRIDFLGHCDAQTVINVLAKARLSVIASECYENNPLGVIESLYVGTPVVGAEIGGIPELLNDSNGIKFKSGDSVSLKAAINEAFVKNWNYEAIKNDAKSRFSPQTYLQHTLDIYKKPNL